MKRTRFGVLVLLCLVLILGSMGCSKSEPQPQDESPADTTDITPPSAPSNLSKTTPDTDFTPTFTWSPATDAGSGVAYYLVRIDSGTWVKISNVTSYTVMTPLVVGNHAFEVKSVDDASNQGLSIGLTFVCVWPDTTQPTDTIPPAISSITVLSITTSSATITWVTDEDASSDVEYGTTTSYGSASVPDSSLVTIHTVNLTGLTADTTYHFRVISKDAAGNEAISGDNSFPTLALPDIAAPVISGVASVNPSMSGVTITWTTNERATSQVEYGLTTGYGTATTLATDLVANHSVTLTGLASGTTYHYRVKSKDSADNEAVSGDFSFTTAVPPDTTAPVISGVGSSNITTSSATISWTTSEPATSQVEYGLTTSYGSTTTLNTNLVTSHSIGLMGLSANVTYHFRVKSKDASNNGAISGDFSFTMPDTLAPTISSVGLSYLEAHDATVTWLTNEPSTSQVYYGLTTACELSTPLNSALVFSHSVALSGLSSETTYYFRVRSIDTSGNEAVSGLFYFVTATCPDLGNWIDTYYYCYGELPVVPSWMGFLIVGYYDGMHVYQGMTVLVASAQGWNRLMPSQQEQVLQTVEWLGGNRDDYLWQIYRLSPP